MDSNKELIYRLYLQRNEEFVRSDIKREFSRYDDIRDGDVEKVKKNYANIKDNFFEGKGVLSKDPVRNCIYHMIVSVSFVARMCINAGLPHDVAYTISDIYIQKADLCTNVNDVLDLIVDCHVDFAKQMRSLKKQKPYSTYVRHAIDYIYDHLHEQITLKQLAELENLNESYFSKLFAKEVGTTVKSYILQVKISTAKNMLEKTGYSASVIADSLGFSSQSAFTAAFKKISGVTPTEYRLHLNYTNVNTN